MPSSAVPSARTNATRTRSTSRLKCRSTLRLQTASAGKGDQNQEGVGGGGVPMMAYTSRFRPKGVPFFRLYVNGMVGIFLVEVYRRRRKIVILVCERA